MKKVKMRARVAFPFVWVYVLWIALLPAGAQKSEPITLNFVHFAPAANVVEYPACKERVVRPNQSACRRQVGDQREGGTGGHPAV